MTTMDVLLSSDNHRTSERNHRKVRRPIWRGRSENSVSVHEEVVFGSIENLPMKSENLSKALESLSNRELTPLNR